MFGPNVTIIGGDHNFDVIGKPMALVNCKSHATDRPVGVEDEVWIGAGMSILKGVRIGWGRGGDCGLGSYA